MLVGVSLIFSVKVFRKVNGISIFQTLSGYELASIWLFLSILNDQNQFWLISETPQGIAFLTIIIIAAALFLTNASSKKRRNLKMLQAVIKFIGYFLIGVFFVQFLVPQGIIILSGEIDPVPRFHPIILLILSLWGLLILIYLNRSDLRLNNFTTEGRIPFLLRITRVMGFGGMIIVILQPAFSPFVQNHTIDSAIFIASRLVVQIAILLFFFSIWDNPVESLDVGRQLSNLFTQERIGIGVFSLQPEGPIIWYSEGFSFLGNGTQQSSRLLALGVAAMVSLGQEDSYLEDSVMIPLVSGSAYTALAMGSWIRDPTQKDPRMNGRSFVVGVIVLPKHFDWIFDSRTLLEKSFKKLMHSIEQPSDLTPEQFYSEVKRSNYDIALKS